VDGQLIDENVNWRETRVARAALTYAPTDSLTITPSVYWQDELINNTEVFYENGSSPKDSQFVTVYRTGSRGTREFTLSSLSVDWDIHDNFALTSISSFFDSDTQPKNEYSFYLPSLLLGPGAFEGGTYLPLLPEYVVGSFQGNGQKNFTQEFRIQNT